MATQNVTQTTRLAPFQEDFLADIFAQAEALKQTPMPFAPQQLAALSQDQQDAIALGKQGIGSYQPFMQAATAALGQSGAFNQPGAAQQFMNPFTEDVIARTQQDIADRGAQQQLQAQAMR